MMSGADVAGSPVTERSRILFYPVQTVVADLAIPISSSLLAEQMVFQHYLRTASFAAFSG